MNNDGIKTNNLVKQFKGFRAVDQINLTVSKGAIHGFVGPNGAGKTTTIKMLIGAVLPTSGTGKILGFPIGSKESKCQLGYVPEKSTFYHDLNALEYLIYMGRLSGLSYDEAKNKANQLLKQFELSDVAFKFPIHFSSGMKKKLTIAQALMHDPKILILDEPTANLDPETRMFVMNLLKKLSNEQQLTIFISSHILTELELLVDEVTLLNKGKIVLSGSINDVRARFKQGVYSIESDNNILLMNQLKSLPYIQQLHLDGRIIRIYTKGHNQLKKDISRLLYKHDLALNYFEEEKITLDSIYASIFNKKEKEVVNDDGI
jgi:ABC-type multidrug transport system ATPase subunit